MTEQTTPYRDAGNRRRETLCAAARAGNGRGAMSDVINHKQLARVISSPWNQGLAIRVQITSRRILLSDGFAIFSVQRGSETISRLTPKLRSVMWELPQGKFRLHKNSEPGAEPKIGELWKQQIEKKHRVEELTRTDVLYNPRTVVSHDVYVRYYSPRFWVQHDYDQCINHDAQCHILYYRNQSDALVAEGPQGPFAAIMPMAVNMDDLSYVLTDYATSREVVNA